MDSITQCLKSFERVFNRMLKKSLHGLFQRRKRKTRISASLIFNGLQPSNMAVSPCAAHRLPKNRVFRQPAENPFSWRMQRPGRRLGPMLWLLLAATAVAAAGIEYKAVAIGEEKGWIVIDIVEQYQLSDTMIEALENGVPLSFVTEAAIEPEDAWFWQKPLASKHLRRTLRYHPLAESYEVRDSITRKSRFFATREAALTALGDIQGWKLVRADRLKKNQYYRVTVESWHDIGRLPLPLRPRAWLTPSWHLSSKVYEWRLQP